MYLYMCIHIVYIYILRERERKRETKFKGLSEVSLAVKQDFKRFGEPVKCTSLRGLKLKSKNSDFPASTTEDPRHQHA